MCNARQYSAVFRWGYDIYHPAVKGGGMPQHQKPPEPFMAAQAISRQSGQHDKLADIIEQSIAQIRLQQQNYSLAAELASKSNALAGSDSSLKRSNYLIIADAKRASGDAAGARVAQSRADSMR